MSKNFLKLIIILFIPITFLSISSPVKATDVSGDITTNTTWNNAGSPYIMTNNVIVSNNATLTIDSSGGAVDIKSNGNYLILIQSGSTLNAVGSIGNLITFTHNSSTDPGAWSGIYSYGNVNIAYSEIKYSQYGIVTNGGTTSIVDSLLERNSYALGVQNAGTLTTRRNTFNKQTSVPVYIEWDCTYDFGTGGDADILGTDTNKNGYNGIGIYGTETENCPGDVCTVSQDTFGGITNIPYVVIGSLNLRGSNDVINIDPGVIIKFVDGGVLYVTGGAVMNINGAVGNLVYFTGIRDDIGNDTNNDGSGSSPGVNNWSGINVWGPSTVVATYASIKYSNLGVQVSGGALTVSDSLFESNNWGVGVLNAGTLTTRRNTFNKQTLVPVYIEWDCTYDFGTGGDADILGTDANKNGYNGIGIYPTETENCPGDVCTVSQDTFGGIPNIPYIVMGGVNLRGSNDVINIDPGVIIKFVDGGILYVTGGALMNINGAVGNLVYFTGIRDDIGNDTNNDGSGSSPAVNNWSGINVWGPSTVVATYASIKYSNLGVQVYGGTLTVSDSLFESNNSGVVMLNAGTLTTRRNTFNKQISAPVYIEWDCTYDFGIGEIDKDILGTGANENGYNGIGIYPTETENCPGDVCTVSQDTFGGITNIPYIVAGGVNLRGSNDVINIDPGVIIKFVPGGILYVMNGASLNLNGSVASPIYFTSIRDDIGGDTNNDEGGTTPAPGNWEELRIYTGTNTVSYAVIRYANLGIRQFGGSLDLSDSTIEYNLTGLYFEVSSSPTLSRLNIMNNTNYGLYNNNATVISAQNLYWDSADGPNDGDNGGQCTLNSTTGDTVTDTNSNPVLYCPFATSPFTSNSLPVVSNVQINGGAASINLTANTTTNVACTSSVTDANGYDDIQSVTAKLYRTGVGAEAIDNINNHYTLTGDSECIPSSGSGNTESYTCTFEVYYLADPTDVGSANAADNWSCSVTATDAVGPGSAVTVTAEMNTLTALEITSPLDYGSIDAGSNTESFNPTVTVTNVGNNIIDLNVVGTDMCTDYPTCAGGVLPVGYQEFSLTGFTYGAGTDLTIVNQSLDVDVAKSTVNPSNSTRTIYWGLGIPADQINGDYTGLNTISAFQSL